jgi:hypothetical protein
MIYQNKQVLEKVEMLFKNEKLPQLNYKYLYSFNIETFPNNENNLEKLKSILNTKEDISFLFKN